MTDPGGPRHDDAVLTVAAVRAAVTDDLAAAVVRVDGNGVVRRRVFLTLAAAERSVRRAEAAGQSAAVVLVRLSPVTVLGGEDR